jgi:hypothetical protein
MIPMKPQRHHPRRRLPRRTYRKTPTHAACHQSARRQPEELSLVDLQSEAETLRKRINRFRESLGRSSSTSRRSST